MGKIPFQIIDWGSIDKTIRTGKTGHATWQTVQYPGLRIRLVEYSKGYNAGHWCQKGHIVYCRGDEFVSGLATGEEHRLTQGTSYVVSDDTSSHLSVTETIVNN